MKFPTLNFIFRNPKHSHIKVKEIKDLKIYKKSLIKSLKSFEIDLDLDPFYLLNKNDRCIQN